MAFKPWRHRDRSRHTPMAAGLAAWLLVAGAVPPGARAQNAPCTLRGPVTLGLKPRGEGRKVILSAGVSLELVGGSGDWLWVRSGKVAGWLWAVTYRRQCVVAAAPSLDDLPLEPLPTTPPPASPVPSIPPPMPTTPSFAGPPPAPSVPEAAPPWPPAVLQQMDPPREEAAGVMVTRAPGSPTPTQGALLIGGAASLVTGGILYGINAHRASQLTEDMGRYNAQSSRSAEARQGLSQREAQVHTWDAWAIGLGAVGVAAMVAGGVWWHLDEGPQEADDTQTQRATPLHLRLAFGPQGAWVAGRF